MRITVINVPPVGSFAGNMFINKVRVGEIVELIKLQKMAETRGMVCVLCCAVVSCIVCRAVEGCVVV